MRAGGFILALLGLVVLAYGFLMDDELTAAAGVFIILAGMCLVLS